MINRALTLFRRRKAKADRYAFSALIAEPAEGAIVAPANARIGVRAHNDTDELVKGATVTGPRTRIIFCPPMVAGSVYNIGYVERGSTITPEDGFSAVVDIGLGRWALIGEPEE